MAGFPFEQMTLIGEAVAAIGSPAFPDALRQLCLDVYGFDSLFVSVFSADQPPLQLYSDLDPEATRRTVGPYLSFAYLLDPFYGVYRSDPGDRVVSLDDCAPDDFRESEYYRMFYAETGLYDEIVMLVASTEGTAIALSLGQRTEDCRPGPQARAHLDGLLPVVSELCRKHWPQPVSGSAASEPAADMVFATLSQLKVSTREGEIIRLMLKGHSTKSIARILGNSPETVKVHRKRIYSKLKISSQGELFSLLLGGAGG
ncbi:helix-turn-helix transcriptional regulator [Ensifer sp. ENS07]|nr:hypothetical protein N182_15095 [Sinorhizobium sp. GL2]MBD9639966.1 helix-turn-helix transcriptional regulator [Ensifer sp. ENS07]